jgi:hypothetical protein
VKTRSGFVSNSSTSSFAVLGYTIDRKALSPQEAGEKLLGVPCETWEVFEEQSFSSDVTIISSEYNGEELYGELCIGISLSGNWPIPEPMPGEMVRAEEIGKMVGKAGAKPQIYTVSFYNG